MFVLEVEDIDLMTHLYYNGFISVTRQAKLMIILNSEVFRECQLVCLSKGFPCVQA